MDVPTDIPVAGEERVLIKNHGKRVVEQDFVYPDGVKTDPWLLFDGEKVPVIIFPYTDDGSVVLVRQFCHAANSFVLELPGGCQEPGQSLEDAVKIELRQETGYVADQIVRIGAAEGIWFEPHNHRVRFFPYLALGCRRVGEPTLDPTERLIVEITTIADFLEMVASGEVSDSKTITTSTLVFQKLRMLNYL
jgi:ADP-ribose pyrophosphatase